MATVATQQSKGKGHVVDYTGRTQWSLMFVCPADLEPEADRVFASHAEWMQRTHHREGEKALLQYTVTKGPHPERDDAVVYAMTEVYRSPAGPDSTSAYASHPATPPARRSKPAILT